MQVGQLILQSSGNRVVTRNAALELEEMVRYAVADVMEIQKYYVVRLVSGR